MKNLISKVSRYLVDNPKKLIVLSLLQVVLLGLGVSYLKADFTYRIWLAPNDPLLLAFDRFEETFGNDDSLVLLVHSPNGIFDQESMKVLSELTEKLWLVPDILRVESLVNFQWTSAKDDEILIEDFIQKVEDPNYLLERKKLALNDPMLPGYLINRGGDVATVFGKLRPYPNKAPDATRLVKNARALVKEFNDRGDHKIYIHGPNVITASFAEVSAEDSKIMVPMVIFLIIFFLWFFFKRVWGVLLPFIVIIITLISTFGIAGFTGIIFNNVIFMVPFVIMAISIADTVHILVAYFQFRKRGANKYEASYLSIEKNFIPTLLTSISTSFGFFSFSNADIIPLAGFGILSGIGTLLAWQFTLTLVVPILTKLDIRVDIKGAEHQNPELKGYQTIFKWINAYRMKWVILGLASFIVSVYLGFQNEVNSNTYEFFNTDVPIYQANQFALKKLGGITGPQIVIDSGKPEGVKDIEFLKKVDKFQDWLEALPFVNKIVCVLDILKPLNKAFHGDDQSYYRLPETNESVAQFLFLYSLSLPPGMDINDQVSLNQQKMRMSILWQLQNTNLINSNILRIKEKAKEIGLDVQITGKIPIFAGMGNMVVDTFFRSIGIALVGISIILMIFFRSVKIGLFSMLPNVIPLGFGSGLMTLMDKPIDVGSALVTSVCLGIVVDDTIHFLSHYYSLVKKGSSPEEAAKEVIRSTGSALFTTSIILMVGFGVLSFSSFVPNINFGIFTSFILGVALLIDLTFLPALLLVSQSRKNRSI